MSISLFIIHVYTKVIYMCIVMLLGMISVSHCDRINLKQCDLTILHCHFHTNITTQIVGSVGFMAQENGTLGFILGVYKHKHMYSTVYKVMYSCKIAKKGTKLDARIHGNCWCSQIKHVYLYTSMLERLGNTWSCNNGGDHLLPTLLLSSAFIQYDTISCWTCWMYNICTIVPIFLLH